MKVKTTLISLLLSIILLLPFSTSHKKIDFYSPSQSYSHSDVYWLAMNMYHEAGNQSEFGKAAVGIVTLNRLYHPNLFETSVERVVKENRQFSWYHLKKDHRPHDEELWKECVKIAILLLTERYNPDIIAKLHGATHFHATYVKPLWRKSMIKVAQIEDHIFYRMKTK